MRKLSKRDKVVTVVIAILAVLAFIWMVSPLLDAIAYAIVLSYISRPIAHKLKKYVGLPLASLLTLTVLVLVIIALLAYTGTQIFVEIGQVSSEDIVQDIVSTSKLVTRFLESHPELEPLVNAVSEQFNEYMKWMGEKVLEMIFQFVSLVITLVLSFVIAFFLVADGPRIGKFLRKALPTVIVKEIDWMDKNLYGIFVGSVFSAFIVGVITTIVFLLAGINYAFLAGVFAGLLQFIPMVGPQLFLIPGAFLFLLARDYFHALVLFILSAFLFVVPDNVIKPIIMKKTTDIHPVLVLISFIGGVMVMGAKGFVLGPLVLVIACGLVRLWLKLE